MKSEDEQPKPKKKRPKPMIGSRRSRRRRKRTGEGWGPGEKGCKLEQPLAASGGNSCCLRAAVMLHVEDDSPTGEERGSPPEFRKLPGTHGRP